MIDQLFSNVIADLTDTFFNPQKRVFIGYLFGSFIVGLVWLLYVKKTNLNKSLSLLLSKEIWWSNSAKSDYKIFFINKLLMLIISPVLITQIVVTSSLFFTLHTFFPSRPILLSNQPDWLIALIFTICYFLLDDFFRFYVHRFLHKWPVLWAFHKVHHSAETLTPITVFRTHPIEMIIFSLRSIFVQAIAIAGFVFFLGERADLVTVLGANLFIFFFNLLGSNLRHSHVSISYWKPIEKIVISPAQHQIHHSSDLAHHDKNFGVVLSIWDWMFGSLHHSNSEQKLRFGLDRVTQNSTLNSNDTNTKHKQTLTTLYLGPFVDAFNSIEFVKALKKHIRKNKSDIPKPNYKNISRYYHVK